MVGVKSGSGLGTSSSALRQRCPGGATAADADAADPAGLPAAPLPDPELQWQLLPAQFIGQGRLSPRRGRPPARQRRRAQRIAAFC